MSAAEQPSPAKPTTQFRIDINGLRAWAVVAVVLYHFGVPGFAGGFVGVDVFFVISGFLMTGIVLRGLERGSFSIIDFYMARARRIIPALVGLCAVLMLLGYFLLVPPDYKQLSTHTGYSLAFLSNIAYFQEAGYFDSASHEKWLLHTWSLSVEWQFYIVLPLVMWAVWRIKPGRNVQAGMLVGAFLASLATSIYVTGSNPSAAFFLLHARAWEMLGGGLVLLLSQRVTLSPVARVWLERAGLLLIAASIAIFTKHSVWPGYLALLPVAATMMVLLANNGSVLTGHAIAQWLGDRSYSLYLWHWPVCVALVYLGSDSSPAAIAAGLVITLLLGHLSYILIESQARTWLSGGTLRAAAVLAIGGIMVMAPVLYVWRGAGLPGRFPAVIEMAAAEAANYHPRRAACHAAEGKISPSCRYGKEDASTTALLVGDSHASVLISAVSSAAAEAGSSVTLMTYSGCPYSPGMKLRTSYVAKLSSKYQCAAFNDWVRATILATPVSVPVVIAGRYAGLTYGPNEVRDDIAGPPAYYSKPYEALTPALLREAADNIVATACEAAKGGRPVYLVRPIPEMGVDVPKAASRRMSLGLKGDVSIPMAEYQQRNGWVWAAQDEAVKRCGVKVVDITAPLCRDGWCHGTRDGRPLYFDDDHLSEHGNKLLGSLFAPVFGAMKP